MTTAEELLASAKALLLDFDGPVTALMPPPVNERAADRARFPLEDMDLPKTIARTTDHLAVLRFAAEHVPDRLRAVEHACTEVEVACARTSRPSPGIRALLAWAVDRNLAVAIVSNNSEAAVRTFLDRFDWTTAVRTLACRLPDEVSRMKPDPYLVTMAAKLSEAEPSACVLIGDSISDVEAGMSARVRVVGWAKTPARGSELLKAGAEAIVSPDLPELDELGQEFDRD